MAQRIQLRRDTAANWTSVNPTLAQGEYGYETDTKKHKVGDGSTAWTSLAYTSGLIAANNLSDLANAATARANLGLGNVENTSDANKPVSTAQAAADLVAENNAKSYADTLVTGLWDDRGNFNASVNAYPSSGGSGTAGAILKGDIWTISVAGTLPTAQVVEAGDTVRALIDTPGNTQANWAIAQNNIGYTPQQTIIPETALVSGASIDIAQQNNTLTTALGAITLTISSTATFNRIRIILNATSCVLTLPANSKGVGSDGVASGTNTCTLTGVSGNSYEVMTAKSGADYTVIAKNTL